MPSKLSASTPDAVKLRVLAAPASIARSLRSSAYAKASSLNGAVTFMPRPPAARKADAAARNAPGAPSIASYAMSSPVAAAKARWICGDFECPMGLPITA
jgi:hypothetical protein